MLGGPYSTGRRAGRREPKHEDSRVAFLLAAWKLLHPSDDQRTTLATSYPREFKNEIAASKISPRVVKTPIFILGNVPRPFLAGIRGQ